MFTRDIEKGQKLAEQIESGMVFVNQPAWTSPEMPFGGIKNSGFGRELSELGFGEFVNRKVVKSHRRARRRGDRLQASGSRH